MNDFTKKYDYIFVESDDTEDRYDRNGLNFLFYWKAKYPKFKISLFTIPGRTSKEMLALLQKHSDWIEILVHGYSHSSNFENFDWDFQTTLNLLESLYNKGYKRIYKAPGWTITPDLCGYPAREDQLIFKDKQAVYKALSAMDFIVADRHYNKPRRLEGAKYICVDCQPNLIHMHTWDMPQGSEPNGYRQVEEQKGVPWDQETEFYFLTDAWNLKIINECKP